MASVYACLVEAGNGPGSISVEGKMRGAILGFMLGLIVGSTGIPTATLAANANDDPIAAPDPPEPTLVLHVVNYAALSRDVLDTAMARAAAVYKVIGVRTVWVESERPVSKHHDGGLHLSVVMLSHDMARKKITAEDLADDVLGHALPQAGLAYVFCDRVASMPGTQVFRIQLGAVIAHEVGHLLLGEKSHSRTGIMRADIDGQHALHLASFDKAQARVIRVSLSERTTGAVAR